MSRSLPEWIGKTPDSPIPPRVRLRVFERHNGVCHISGRKIRPGEAWECDHIVAVINGGEHRESNLAPALVDPHKEKTALDVAEKSVSVRKRKKHLGIKKPSTWKRWSKFKKKVSGEVVDRETGEPVRR